MIEIGKVINSTPGNIQVLLNSIDDFENNKARIKISKYLSIEDGNDLLIQPNVTMKENFQYKS